MKIDLNNYEEWMVSFLDKELNANEIIAFNKFIDAHPELKSELNSFEEVQFKPESNVVYDNKESLYKKSGALLLLKKAWPIAAAIALLLAIWPFVSKKEEGLNKIVKKIKKIETKNESGSEKYVTNNEDVEDKEEEVASVVKKNDFAQVSSPTIKTGKEINFKSKTSIIEKVNTNQIEKIDKQKVDEQVVDVPKKTIIKEEIKIEPKQTIPFEKPKNEMVVQKNEVPIKIMTPVIGTEEEMVGGSNNALVIIDEVTYPKLYNKINTVVTEVEEKLETIKELKRKPITVCIGKRKIFTINN